MVGDKHRLVMALLDQCMHLAARQQHVEQGERRPGDDVGERLLVEHQERRVGADVGDHQDGHRCHEKAGPDATASATAQRHLVPAMVEDLCHAPAYLPWRGEERTHVVLVAQATEGQVEQPIGGASGCRRVIGLRRQGGEGQG